MADGCPRVDFAGDIMPVKPNGEPYVHEFLVAWEIPTVRLHPHEYLTQFSVAGELVGVYEQPVDRLLAEAPLDRDDSRGIRGGAYAIDLATFDAPCPPRGRGKPVIGAEIKLTRESHHDFVTGRKKCRGLLAKKNCRTDHRKCEWVQQNLSVEYLWVRSQDHADLFKVLRAADGGFDLEPVAASQIQGVLSRQNWS